MERGVMIRPPNRNLSPMSEPWGRWIEGEVQNIQRQADRLGLDSSNDGRINNSSMDQMAARINELQERSIRSIATIPPPIPTPTTGTWYYQTFSVSLPGPDVPRWGMVSISIVSPPTQDQHAIYLRAEANGDLLMSSHMQPSGGSGQRMIMPGYTATIVYDSTLTIDVTLGAIRFSGSTAAPIPMGELTASVSYAQRV